jgi:hypothetical protein
MAVADYFGRNAVAAAQAIMGLDEQRLASLLANVRVGITIGRDASGAEGTALVDLLIRLIARLYPSIAIRAEGRGALADNAAALASRINPSIEFIERPTIEIVVGATRLKPWASIQIFAGCTDWTAAVSTSGPRACGQSNNPFGAGAAACLVAANLFRHAFLPVSRLDVDAIFNVMGPKEAGRASLDHLKPIGEVVLAGAGAIGNATGWALARTPIEGTLAIVDHEAVDLGNLQRYVLAERDDEGAAKPAVLARNFAGPLSAQPYCQELAAFAEERAHRIEHLLLAVDSARDRRAGQAVLPRWIANAWTQPGDLGVSVHDFLDGACVSCLYLPQAASMSEDAIIAEAFGVPARVLQIRLLLHKGEGVPRDLLEAIALARDVSLETLLPFEGRPVRALYSDGFCGGAVIPLARIGAPRSELHVPLAHQSALAGILLAAAAVRRYLAPANGSTVTQMDVLKPLPEFHSHSAAKDPRGICICQDEDYRAVYRQKFAIDTGTIAPGRSGNAKVTRKRKAPRQRMARK